MDKSNKIQKTSHHHGNYNYGQRGERRGGGRGGYNNNYNRKFHHQKKQHKEYVFDVTQYYKESFWVDPWF